MDNSGVELIDISENEPENEPENCVIEIKDVSDNNLLKISNLDNSHTSTFKKIKKTVSFFKNQKKHNKVKNVFETWKKRIERKPTLNLEKIITKMSSKSKKGGNIEDVFFSISGNEKGIKFGNIGGFHRLFSLMQ